MTATTFCWASSTCFTRTGPMNSSSSRMLVAARSLMLREDGVLDLGADALERDR